MSHEIIAELRDRFTIRWNEEFGSCEIDLIGFWSEADAEYFYPALGKATVRSRGRHGFALLLFDTTQAKVMSGYLFSMFQIDRNVVGAHDRVAVICSSSLLKMQIKQLANPADRTEHFVSRSAAQTWLYAHVQPSEMREPLYR